MKLSLAALVVCAGTVASAASAAASAADYAVPRPQRRSPDDAMTLCGSNLANARALFCYEAGYALKKKSVFSPLAEALARYEARGAADGENEVEGPGGGWPWLGHHRANAFTASGRGKRGGIVEECCYKPCTREELLTYC